MANWPEDLFNGTNQIIGFAYGNLEDQVKELKDYKQKADPKGGLLGIHYLPLPANIEDNTTHDWERKDSLTSQTVNKIGSAAGDAISKRGGMFAAAVDFVKTAGDVNGIKVDPNYTYVYQGSAPRSFNYSISMIPKNKDEAESIQKIVKDFKKFSAPFKAQFVKNSYWQIEIVNDKLRQMIKFDKKAWALTSVSLNYCGAGSALFFEYGMPKHINLSLSFQEI
jgi:hypothetical protein